MTDSPEPCYRLVPGFDFVPLDDGTLAVRSDTLSLHLRGLSTGFFRSRIVPLLEETRSFSELAALLPPADHAALRRHLDELVGAGVLVSPDGPSGDGAGTLGPWLEMMRALGIDPRAARERLRTLRVAIFGLEGHGSHLASVLQSCGVGRLTLVDPYPCEPGNIALMNGVGEAGVGTPRELLVRAALAASARDTEVRVSGREALSAETVDEIARDSDMLAGCFDRGMSAGHLWINAAGLRHGRPAIYSQSRAHLWSVGPLVVPGETACLACLRQRELACASDFFEARAYEAHLDEKQAPSLHERGVFPPAMPYLAGLMGAEILKHLLLAGTAATAGRVCEINVLSLHSQFHPVLRHPSCPVCFPRPEGTPPPLRVLLGDEGGRVQVGHAREWLVSGRSGIVRSLRAMRPARGSPPRPFLVSATLSNHRRRAGAPAEVAGGKGFTLDEARVGALGEAMEWYAADSWCGEPVVHARRDELSGPTLDPARLVLYAPHQYPDLPYRPFDGSNVLGWLPARSLVNDSMVRVPAAALLLRYGPGADEPILPSTSNGLASGGSLCQAVLGALLEVLERDAFMIAWLRRARCDAFDPLDHPDPAVVELVRAFRRRMVEIRLLRFPTDHPATVFAALGLAERAGAVPSACIGLGADLDPSTAARKAILELAQVRGVLVRRMSAPGVPERMEALSRDPGLVAGLDDHQLLYAHPDSRARLAFLVDRPVQPWPFPAPATRSPAEGLSELVDHFGASRQDVLYADLTPPDVASAGFFVARVLVPDFQPIHFGAREARLGGRRLYDRPLDGESVPAGSALNPDPHPLG